MATSNVITEVNSWQGIEVKTFAEASSLRLMIQIDSKPAGSVSELYIDNVKVVLPGNIETGVGFEVNADTAFATANKDVTLTRVSYQDAGLTVDAATYGNYAMKGAATTIYPRFTINLGTTVETGTVVTFDLYTDAPTAEYSATADVVAWVKNSATGNSNLTLAAVSGHMNTWKTVTLTTTQATSALNLMLEFRGITNGVIPNFYIDNVKAVTP